MTISHLPGEVNPDLLARVDQMLEAKAQAAHVPLINPQVDEDATYRCEFDPEKGIVRQLETGGSVCAGNSALPVTGNNFVRFFPKQNHLAGKTALLETLLEFPWKKICHDRAFREFQMSCRFRQERMENEATPGRLFGDTRPKKRQCPSTWPIPTSNPAAPAGKHRRGLETIFHSSSHRALFPPSGRVLSFHPVLAAGLNRQRHGENRKGRMRRGIRIEIKSHMTGKNVDQVPANG